MDIQNLDPHMEVISLNMNPYQLQYWHILALKLRCVHDDIIKWKRFSELLAICMGHLLVTGEFPAQRPVMQSFDVFFDLCLNKQLSKQLWGWWFEMPLHPLWHHCNDLKPQFPLINMTLSRSLDFDIHLWWINLFSIKCVSKTCWT